MRAWICGGLMLGLLGCRGIEPAPEDLDALVHYVWDHVDEGSDEELAEAIINLHAAIDGDSLQEFEDGTISSLSRPQVEPLGIALDPADATGVYINDPIGCTLEQLEQVITYPRQDELYVGVYDDYDREMIGSREAYLSGESRTIGWDLRYTSGALGVSYTGESTTHMRRVDAIDEEITPYGPFVVLRAHLREPASFDGDANYLKQDYHLEIYWSRGADLLHVYGLWKDTKMLGFEDEGETTQRLILNNLADWDEGTSEICAAGGDWEL